MCEWETLAVAVLPEMEGAAEPVEPLTETAVAVRMPDVVWEWVSLPPVVP